MGKVNYNLTVGLNEPEFTKIAEMTAGAAPPIKKVSDTAASVLADLANGAILIPPEWAARVYTAIEATDVPTIVQAVEASVDKQGDSTVVPWVVDPTHVQHYQMLADNAGISLEQQLKSVMDLAYSQGWFGMNAPEPFQILLTPEQYRYLQQLFEKDVVTGEDVFEKIRREAGSPGMVSEEDDPLLESLKERRR